METFWLLGHDNDADADSTGHELIVKVNTLENVNTPKQ